MEKKHLKKNTKCEKRSLTRDRRDRQYTRLNSKKIQAKLKKKDDGWITSEETPVSLSFCLFFSFL